MCLPNFLSNSSTLGNFACLICHLLIFFTFNFFEKFRNTISVKQFGTRSGLTFCQADLGSN